MEGTLVSSSPAEGQEWPHLCLLLHALGREGQWGNRVMEAGQHLGTGATPLSGRETPGSESALSEALPAD